MEETAKRDAVRKARLLRLAKRLEVLMDLAKSTADSLQSLVVATCPLYSDPGKDYLRADAPAGNATPYSAACKVAERAADWQGDHTRLDVPPAQHPRDPLERQHVTRGTVMGILDRIEDAIERADKVGAQHGCRELRFLVDELPL